MSDVFISYSRLDKEFVGKLRDALNNSDQEVWIDWESIPESRAWWDEIKKGIARANNFAVVLSPNSMASPICQLEIEYALELNKRVIPIYHADFDRKTALLGIAERLADDGQEVTREIWEHRQAHELYDNNDRILKRINYFFFKEMENFDERFEDLLDVIQTDYDHNEHHTTIEVRASEWIRRNQDNAYLLIGNELKQAQTWITSAHGKNPEPTELHYEFIKASERRNRQLQTIRWTAVIGTIVATFAIVASLIAGQNVINASNVAATSEFQADINLETATNAQGKADGAATQVAESNVVATQSTILRQSAEDFAASIRIANIAQDVFASGQSLPLAIALALEATYIDPAPQNERVLSEIAYSSSPQGFNIDDFIGLSAVFSPDGSKILFGGRSQDFAARSKGLLILFDSKTHAELMRFTGHEEGVTAVAFSPDSSQIVSGSEDGKLILWDTNTSEILHQLDQLEQGVLSVSFSPNGQWIASSSGGRYSTKPGSKEFIIWDSSTGNVVYESEDYNGAVEKISFTPDSSGLVFAVNDTVFLWDIDTQEVIREFGPHPGLVIDVTMSPTGKHILSTSFNSRSLFLWDASSGNQIDAYDKHFGAVWTVAFSPDGSKIVSGSYDAKILVTDTLSGETLFQLEGHEHEVNTVAFSPDGSKIISSGSDGNLFVWNTDSSLLLRRVEGHNDPVNKVVFSNDGTEILSVSSDEILQSWNVQTGEEILNFEDNIIPSLNATPSTDDTQIISSGEAILYSSASQLLSGGGTNTYGLVELWDRESAEKVRQFDGLSFFVSSGAISPDGTRVIAGTRDGNLIMWDVATGSILRRFYGHEGRINSIAFSPNGRQIVTGSEDGSLILWRNDNLFELQTWTIENRNIQELTCDQRLSYNLTIKCNDDGSLPLTSNLAPVPAYDLIHQPEGGRVELYDTSLRLGDFDLEVTFLNPYGANMGTWDYGIIFRHGGKRSFRLILKSDGWWQLRGDDDIIPNQGTAGINVGEGEENHIRLRVRGENGSLSINDGFVVRLDLSSKMAPGEIRLGTGFIEGNEMPGSITRFENLSIQAVGIIPALTPFSATNQ